MRQSAADWLTLTRLPLGAGVLLARHHRRVAAGLFALAVATDAADGPIARRLGTASDRGARLDSIVDAAFVVAAAPVAACTISRSDRRLVAAGSAVVTLTRLATLVSTRRRFGLWSIAHTRLNKLSGAALAAVTTVALARDRMSRPALVTVAVIAELAAIEELVMVRRSDRYDRDRASVPGPTRRPHAQPDR